MSACCSAELATEARIAAEEILADYFLVDVRKALDPLNATDFVTIVQSIANAMKGKVEPVETKALKDAIEALDVDWKGLPKEARWKFIDHVRNTYFAKLPDQVMPAIDQSLNFYAKDLVTSTKSKAVKKFDLKIAPNLNAFDSRVLSFVTKSQGHFVRNELGQRSESFSVKARAIVESGLDQGLGSGEIAAKLHDDLSQPLGRGRGYWDMIAMVFANRARTMTQLGGFAEAGIDDFVWESVMDEVTSVQCRFLHGRRFPVARAMDHFESVETLDDPEDIKVTTPFMNFGNVDGKPSLYVGRKGDGPVTAVAHVTQNAVGMKDHPGAYANAKGDKELLALGVSTPPIHGRCRSTIIPEMSALEHAPAPGASAIVPPEPVKPPPKPKTPPAPPLPTAFTDPAATITFHKEPLYEGLPLNGVPLAPATKGYWTGVPDAIDEPPVPVPTAAKKVSSGVIVVEPDGRLWVIEPKDHFGGYEHTYPKGKIEKGLTSQQNALKELFEEAGLAAEIKGVVGDFEGSTSTTRYYVAHRTGGAPWAAHWESQAVKLASPHEAEKMLNQQRDKDVLAALQKKLAADPSLIPKGAPPAKGKKPKVVAPAHVGGGPIPENLPAAPQPVSSQPPLTADVILDRKIGEARGSNKGGLYRGKDGVDRYVKFYGTPLQGESEHLANSIYRDLGLGAPKSTLFTDSNGRPAYASEIIPGGKTLREAGLTQANARAFMKGFVGDVLTGNWDAVGRAHDNAIVVGDKLYRIDNGGTFLLRAQGGRKDASALNAITEWDYFFTGNAEYRAVAKAAGYSGPDDFAADVAQQIKSVVALRDAHGGWGAYVARVAPGLSPSDRSAMVGMLEARTGLLEQKLVALTKPRPPPPVVFPPFEAHPVAIPLPNAEVLAIKHFDDLPLRAVPEDLDSPPGGLSLDEYKRRAASAKASLSREAPDSYGAVYDFTGMSYGSIRRAQRDKDTWSAAGRKAIAIEKAFEVVEPVPGQVFRAIREKYDNKLDLNSFLASDVLDLLGTSSSSRTARESIKGFLESSRTKHRVDPDDPTPRVFFVIHQKTGIPVERVSQLPDENEVLLSARARYRVLGRYRATQNPKAVLVVEMEEIGEDAPADAPKKTPRRRKKPPA